jgi:hypothetical protein
VITLLPGDYVDIGVEYSLFPRNSADYDGTSGSDSFEAGLAALDALVPKHPGWVSGWGSTFLHWAVRNWGIGQKIDFTP